jgi:hypothetical protein
MTEQIIQSALIWACAVAAFPTNSDIEKHQPKDSKEGLTGWHGPPESVCSSDSKELLDNR